MRVNDVLIAEGAAVDTRGALTLVGVNQRVITSVDHPVNLTLKLILILTDDIVENDGFSLLPPPYDGQLQVMVTDPREKQAFSWAGPIQPPGKKTWSDLPLIVNVLVDIKLTGDYGVYKVDVKYSATGADDETAMRIPIYVVPFLPRPTSDDAHKALPSAQE